MLSRWLRAFGLHWTGLAWASLAMMLAMPATAAGIEDEVFYFALTDRFYNADTNNDMGGLSGDRQSTGFDPTDERYYHGGDLAGLSAKLPYLREMGITAIWISPPFKNIPVSGNSAAYHGYWAVDYTQVDPHWGTNEELAEFVQQARKMRIKVFLDVVINHTGDVIRYQQCHNPDGTLLDGLSSCPYISLEEKAENPYSPFIPQGLEQAKSPAWLNNPEYYNNQGDSTFSGESSVYGDFFGLDDLNTRDPQVVQGMIDIFKGWISDLKINGFRVDTIKHVDIELWQQWIPAIEAHAEAEGIRDFFIFGENFDGLPANLARFTRDAQFTSVLDFGLYYAIKDAVTDYQGTDRLAWVFSQDDLYKDGKTNTNHLMNFVSNHDVGRIGHFINNLPISEDEKLARAKLAQSLMFFSRGIPVVYYGDEQGFTGDGGDDHAREDMFPSQVPGYNDNNLLGSDASTADDNFDTSHPLYQHIRQLAGAYRSIRPLRVGHQSVLQSENSPGVLALSRFDPQTQRQALVLVNTSDETQNVDVAAMARVYRVMFPRQSGVQRAKDGRIEMELPPFSTRVLLGSDRVKIPKTVPQITFSSLQPEQSVSGLVEVGAVLEDASELGDVHQVHFALSIDGGEFVDIGTDATAGYKVFYDVSELENDTQLTFRATVDNFGKNANSTEITVKKRTLPGITLTFKKPEGWTDSVNLYYWNAGTGNEVQWPGVAMQHEGGDWYRYQMPDNVQSANLIFNDGGANQTADLFREGDGCYIDSNWQDSCEIVIDPEPGMTVYVRRPLSWNVPNLYYWAASGAPQWPGIEMTSLGNDWYSYQFPDGVSAANMIINDLTGNQTADLYRQGDGCYDIENDSWTDSCPVPGFTVYFNKPQDWPNANAYFWEPGPVDAANVGWPGEAMTERGNNWYSYQFPDGVNYSNLIFNDGAGNQSADLFREADGCFDFENGWQDSCTVPEPGMEVLFKAPDGWGDEIHLYYWNAEGAPGWPGIAMQAIGDGWYRFEFPQGVNSANLIFNDNAGNQTGDLYRDASGCYGEFGDFWRNSCITPDAIDVSIKERRAHWLDLGTLAWQVADNRAAQWRLYYSMDAQIQIEQGQLSGADGYLTMQSAGSLSAELTEQNPHLASWPAYAIEADTTQASTALKGQLVAAALDSSGNLLEATQVQAARVIDALYATDTWLGVRYENDLPVLKLWAPTAQSAQLLRYDAQGNLLSTHQADSIENGVYRFVGDSSWDKTYYRYQLSVYHPLTDQVESYSVTDPYALNLSANGGFAQIIDLASDASLKPAGWDALQKSLPEFKDISLYEGHVRDFSINDTSVPEAHRGTYMAFTHNGENGANLSAGMTHLKNLQQAGLTHFHLLPIFDISSVNENPAERIDLDSPFSALCAVSDADVVQSRCQQYGDMAIYEVLTELKDADPTTAEIQAITSAENSVQSKDGFNWGYDPFHFNAPEGTYATDANGTIKVLELRAMVKALADIGLNVVMDVVYNHTSASGLWDNSVLDKVVPGYYQRLNPVSGVVENSTCCDNTATEHQMMEKLMVDTLVNWAVHYKIDSFRFDLMGHIPKSAMLKAQQQLASLNLAEHGVDGQRIYLYGEGWDFGEVSGNQRFAQASQFGMAGTGIATFNDRLRSAARGGNYTSNGAAQGWVNGNGTFANGIANGAGSPLDQADRIRIGMAGNLQGYQFEDNTGLSNTGVNYSGTGYTLDPQEAVNYVDKHDNESFWDNNQGKLPGDFSIDNRVRAHLLGNALINFGQGVPFYQMGTDLLRSKSMDRNSYNSGDWFNAVDFSMQSNNWAVGLPPAQDNQGSWQGQAAVLSNANAAALPQHIQLAATVFQEQLQIRYSSPLFRLDGSDEVNQRLGYHNTGSGQQPGLIAMTLSDGICAGNDLDPQYDGVLVLFNADDEVRTVNVPGTSGSQLHPAQLNGADEQVKTIVIEGESYSVPPLTAAVLVSPQNGAQGEYPCNPSAIEVTEPGMTVYVQKPADWADIRLYYWNTQPATDAVNWPGVPMQALGDNWYSFQFPAGVSATNLIFNNNNQGQQSGDLYREGDGCFDISANSWSDSCTLPGLSFWFKKPAHWSTPNLYYWNAGVNGPGWPGTAMTDVGDDWYFFQMPDGVRSTNLIFNDADGSDEQTGDLFRNQNGCYENNQWSDSCPPAE
ncbi:pullulanase-type alpha-1,6-glucosidase [Lacimicrobium alkaliphilum]|uniref:Glycosyl hydrolase family 13 catalytic domain-containing protein n=1 Tax=Lacimicrobium alkaliphilum TaxID=1526571 RepID=A0A0U2ZI01_9ALTE|nr:pullulanase-type alpha-1,6-glucosidase [Lacimicrobium alkaliphilum]ALS97964.1 hypothetical protein AT746_06580 [Lacimicrobium alkaliphilum]